MADVWRHRRDRQRLRPSSQRPRRIGNWPYALIRYINQLPADQQFTDHLGNVHDIDARNDIQFHRAMVHFRGWLFSPRARYQITVWTVMSTDAGNSVRAQRAIATISNAIGGNPYALT